MLFTSVDLSAVVWCPPGCRVWFSIGLVCSLSKRLAQMPNAGDERGVGWLTS